MFLQYKENKILIENHFESLYLELQLVYQFEVCRSVGLGFFNVQFTAVKPGLEALFNSSVCISMSTAIGVYRNQSLSKADCFSRLKITVKSVVSRALEFFALHLRDSWEIIYITIKLQYTRVCSSNGKKMREKQWLKNQYAYFQQLFFILFLPCWEGKKSNFIRSYGLCWLVSAKLNLLRLLSRTLLIDGWVEEKASKSINEEKSVELAYCWKTVFICRYLSLPWRWGLGVWMLVL